MIKIILTVISIFAIIYFCIDQPKTIDYVRNFNWYYLILVCFFYCLFYSLNASILLLLIKPYGKKLTFYKALCINQISSFVNYFVPFRVASVGIKMFLLKREFSVSSGQTIGTFALSTLIFIFVCITALVLAINSLTLQEQHYRLYIQSSLFVGGGILCVLWFLIIDQKYRLTKFINLPPLFADIKKSMSNIHLVTLIQLILLYGIQVTVTSAMTYTLFAGAGYELSVALCVLMTTVGNLSGLLALTPANIGIKEITYVANGAIYGVPADIIVAVLLIDRLIQVILLSTSLPLISSFKLRGSLLK